MIDRPAEKQAFFCTAACADLINPVLNDVKIYTHAAM
jgi:hypothetical protein